MSVSNIPTEDQEQEALVQYLRIKGWAHFRVPNETYTTSWSQKAKNKRLGVVKGVPDLFVFANGRRFAIELKRQKGGKASPEQKQWLDVLSEYGFNVKICNGAKEAIDFLEGK